MAEIWARRYGVKRPFDQGIPFGILERWLCATYSRHVRIQAARIQRKSILGVYLVVKGNVLLTMDAACIYIGARGLGTTPFTAATRKPHVTKSRGFYAPSLRFTMFSYL